MLRGPHPGQAPGLSQEPLRPGLHGPGDRGDASPAWLGFAELPKLFLKRFWFNKALNKFCQALFPLIFKPE